MVHICEYLAATYSQQPSKNLSVCQGRQQTAQQMLLRVAALGRALQHQVGLQPGEVVMLAANSTDYFLEALLAAASIGCIVAPINLRWDSQEATTAISLCQASTLLVDTANIHFLAALQHTSSSKLKQAVILGQSLPKDHVSNSLHADAMIQQHMNSPLQFQHAPEDAALICFTSGTTGQPKAALISHLALDHQSTAKIQVVGYHAQDQYLHAAPLFHIGGLSSAMAVMKAGATHVFMGRFSAKATLEAITLHSITAIIAVPAMIKDLAAEATTSSGDQSFPSMERVLVGAGGLSRSLQQKLQTIFPSANCYSAYGMTEACSSMTFSTLCSPADRALPPSEAEAGSAEHGTCVGVPPAGIEMMVLTESNSRQLSSSVIPIMTSTGHGQILTRGPHVFTRYWGQQAATEQAFFSGSWLRTGDFGRIDARGQVWLEGRLKDIVRTGGETVHPSQVEAVLLQHPSVAAVAVFSLPHERLGEQVAAVVVLDRAVMWNGLWLGPTQCHQSSTSALTSGSLIQFCRQALSAYKLPRMIAAQSRPLPLNASGKVMKLHLRQHLLELLSGHTSSGTSTMYSRL